MLGPGCNRSRYMSGYLIRSFFICSEFHPDRQVGVKNDDAERGLSGCRFLCFSGRGSLTPDWLDRARI